MRNHWNAIRLTSEPVLVPLGPTGRAVVNSSTPFMADGVMYCADLGHLVASKRPEAVAWALRHDADGQMRVRAV